MEPSDLWSGGSSEPPQASDPRMELEVSGVANWSFSSEDKGLVACVSRNPAVKEADRNILVIG